MYQEIINIIKQYQRIIISRHNRPDLDALGSQLALKQLILDNFKDKEVYAVGDMSKECFLGQMDEIDDNLYQDALLILTDVSVSELLPNIPYSKANKIICIDHHQNNCNILNATSFYDRKAAAACQIIATLAFKNNLTISETTFRCLFAGIISDTNRFNYSLSKELFDVVGNLINLGFNYSDIYNIMYADSISYVKMRAYFIKKFKVDRYGVAYIFNEASVFSKFKVDLFTISRGMVNVMANLTGVNIWCNFTENPETHKIVCEFRSKQIPIVQIASKYGGGGHELACGVTVDNFAKCKEILKEFDELVKRS